MFGAGGAQASEILNDSGVFDATISYFEPIGQSFVAIDPVLDQITFGFSDANPTFSNDPITMTLFEGEGTGGAVIHSVMQTLPAVQPTNSVNTPLWVDFDFSGVGLTVGDAYTVAVSTTSPKVSVAYGVDSYALGRAFSSRPSTVGINEDLRFRITGTSIIPTPSMWALTMVVLLGTTMTRRFRNDGVA